ncbi:hypothetical protein NIES4106_52370 [Fischerella sp. NIES-4106]|jgi:hypothetical protein|nr:hypothetical protein NIES4106_52370 [Fischerella sp. NIES-4106]
MAIFRQYIAPLLVVLIFLFALVAVSARIFLPGDMAAPAPVEENGSIGRVTDAQKLSVSFLFSMSSSAPVLF